ncbi:uncharacterized protein N7511_011476 [Penicillium nucicola]|uniref:uncharacterized protein n=1 Tax=Penicillium nucicola TaxID=1850975 RepID=UPI0025452584|nr:uncharacterized protein N7511_011476 [Penicillium nucicola]KAJ5742457.1 hypothetical protein N7511_011476 [Penicillium nucicola]
MAADAPGLMDIASTLAQDEIPFKLRCAICNKLAVNAFRLPCCDQSICESCQTSLSDTCPVCAHTPVSPDLCKPNKALRTTLKAFLRTEEKKREKDRQATATSNPATPADTISAQEAGPSQNGDDTAEVENVDAPVATELQSEQPEAEASAEPSGENAPGTNLEEAVEQSAQPEVADEPTNNGIDQGVELNEETANEDPVPQDPAAPQDAAGINSAAMTTNMGGFQMGWNGNGMNPYMASMFNFPNTMGMSIGMDPMANQGIFGDYGMNMNGMGMNTGNFNGGMCGSLGWDAQNNMWQGQDNINPNAFANGTGPSYGGAYGSNIYPDQSGYYGSGYGRGAFRGRGRDHGRGFGPMQGHYVDSGYSQSPINVQGNQNQSITKNTGQVEGSNAQGPDGVPNSSMGNVGYRHGRTEGPGVEGAPAAPRAMRQGLPNTSVLRLSGRVSDDTHQTPLHASSETQSRSPGGQVSRAPSPSTHDDRETQQETELKRIDRVDELQSNARRTRSPSRASSRRSSRHRQRGVEREKERNGSHRSHRSRRHRSRHSRSCSRSRSRASSRNGEARSTRLHRTAVQIETTDRTKAPSEAPEQLDLASRINNTYRPDKDRGSRRENDRTRPDRDTRRRDRDRDRDRERDRRPRERDTQRDSRTEGTRDKDRTSERERNRDHPRDRDWGRDRKRSRRERSPSTHGNDHQVRRVKLEDEDRNRNHTNRPVEREAEKDPYTLEREKRNKERLEREQQHRSKAKSDRRRDSRQDRQDRVVAGRRINYRYEDEL